MFFLLTKYVINDQYLFYHKATLNRTESISKFTHNYENFPIKKII